MSVFEFKNSAGECCPRDDSGNLVPPTEAVVIRNPNGGILAPSQAPHLQPNQTYVPPQNGETDPLPTTPPDMETLGDPPMGSGTGTIVTPDDSFVNDSGYQGSLQQILTDNIGQFVVVEFLIGTQAMTTKQGILYAVGRGYIVLYEEIDRNYVVCDLFSIKFVTFYLPGERPRQTNMQQQLASGQVPNNMQGNMQNNSQNNMQMGMQNGRFRR